MDPVGIWLLVAYCVGIPIFWLVAAVVAPDNGYINGIEDHDIVIVLGALVWPFCIIAVAILCVCYLPTVGVNRIRKWRHNQRENLAKLRYEREVSLQHATRALDDHLYSFTSEV